MKKIISALLTLGLILSLCACGDEKKDDTNKSAKTESSTTVTSAEKTEPAATKKVATEPTETEAVTTEPEEEETEENTSDTEIYDIFPEGVTYTEEYVMESDPGDNLSPAEAALTVVDFFSEHFYFYGGIVNITFDDIDYIYSEECYFYTVEDEMPTTGLCAVNYATGEIYVYVEEDGEYRSVYDIFDNVEGTDVSEDTDISEDIDVLNWSGEYGGEEFSIYINNFDGESFSFAVNNLRNGEEILAGVAAIDPDDKNLAIYGDCGFYLYEDEENIDFLAAESGEWAHLRGQYTQY
ncbi:MAG: hypothetical protein LBM93_00930 [Oscillospiraceae bacterium]|jgi:hypothetical protein|nr:hypothetical protein [Oscillospiraceae bacterium]